MLGLDFVNYVQSWQISQHVSAEDFADKFNSLFTTLLLILCAMIISAKQYVLQPLSCYCHKSNSGDFLEYIKNYCWTTGTYMFKQDEVVNHDSLTWSDDRKINYYQWVPFVLGLQCALYYLPHLFWVTMVTSRLGSDAQYLITEAAGVARESGLEKRNQTLDHLARSVLHMQTAHREYRQGRWASIRACLIRRLGLCVPSKRLGTALICAYLATKLLYLANCFGQLRLMYAFLGIGGYHGNNGTNVVADIIGWQLISSVSSGRDWNSGLFPRTALCRVQIASVGWEVNTCQCALPVNMLNEKIYLFLWFWTLAATAITLISLPVWCHRVALKSSRHRFIRRELFLAKAIDKCNSADRRSAEKFADNLLHRDGVFLFKMMQLNAGDVVTGELLRRLFEMWKQDENTSCTRTDVDAEKMKGGDDRSV